MRNWLKKWRGKEHQKHGPFFRPNPDMDKCEAFWQWVLGGKVAFRCARNVRELRTKYRTHPDFLMGDRQRLLEGCNVYLDLFHLVFVEQDLKKAESLAPVLNRFVPEMMVWCPIKELRPSQAELDAIHLQGVGYRSES